jgi:hypothetical protein
LEVVKVIAWISVNWHDIRRGRRGSHCHCPVALAIKRHRPGLWIVGATQLCKQGNPDFGPVPLPPEVIEFNRRWDAGLEVEPLGFWLDFAADWRPIAA